jgi:hypothetical protein
MTRRAARPLRLRVGGHNTSAGVAARITGGDGVVGLLVVGSGVPARGVIGACDPAAGQTHPQRHPPLPACPTPWTRTRGWLDTDADGSVNARARSSGAIAAGPLGWHPTSSRLGPCPWGRVQRTPGGQRAK